MARLQLRLGLVLYGGSSLAIYMSGMAQELLAAVRAAQARKVLAGTADHPPELQQWAAREAEANPYYDLLELADADLVIDVIAGTSAGGLNGLMLAKALAAGAPELGRLVDGLWRDRADMEALARYDADPKSVLSGDYLHGELRNLLKRIGAAGRPDLAGLARALDLYITATDVRGHRWSRYDRFHQQIEGQSHKYLFHLRKRTRQQGDLRGYNCDDFQADGLLAKIGQATAAFPGVFPPVCIHPAEAREAGVAVLDDLGPAAEEGVWFSDGGILVNAPFEPVLDTLFERGASGRVRRLLVFLEPDPAVGGAAPVQTEPDMLETALAAVTLPMRQDIFDQLERLQAENLRRREVSALMQGMTAVSPAYDAMRLARLRQVLRGGLTRALGALGLVGEALEQTVAQVEKRLAAGGRFLERYDAEYERRRLHHLLAEARERGAPPRVLELLGGALEDWSNALWVIANAGRLGAQPPRWAPLTQALDDAFLQVARDPQAGVDGAVAALEAYMDALGQSTGADLAEAFAADDGCRACAAGFDAVDRLLLPVEGGACRSARGEIGLYGFRPDAARTWVDRRTAEKLTGEALGHFAAFLDPRWRSNDIMWGRLDAAELIFRMVAKEAALPDQVNAPLMRRRRQILAAYPELVSLPVDRASDEDLREYLERDYKVGQEGLADLNPGRLAGTVLLMLENVAEALGKTGPSPLVGLVQRVLAGVVRPLSWVARLVLLPRPGVGGMAQQNLAPLMTALGALLLALWALGAVELQGGGQALLAALFAPMLVDVAFRPTGRRLVLLGLPALLTGGAALATSFGDWAWLDWVRPLARAWAPCLVVLAGAAVAWWSNRRWRRSGRRPARAKVDA